MRFSVSAPGKIILTGEHSVVYGYKAIATSINLRCYANVDLNPPNKDSITLNLKSIPFVFKFTKEDFEVLKPITHKYNNSNSTNAYHSVISDFLDEKLPFNLEDYEFIKSGLSIFIDLYLQTIEEFKSFVLTITSEFSYGCGIGSSAAYSTVIATSLLLISKSIDIKDVDNLSEENLKAINELALRGERIVHAQPSGIDNSISLYGKCVVFQNRSLTILENIPKFQIILVDSGVKRCTSSVVKAVRKMVNENYTQYHKWFSEIHDLSEDFEKILKSTQNDSIDKQHHQQINKLINRNQELLRNLRVSHESIEEIIGQLSASSVSSKLTGAGWGGCVYGLLPTDWTSDQSEQIIEKLSSMGYRARLTSVCCDGVKVHLNSDS